MELTLSLAAPFGGLAGRLPAPGAPPGGGGGGGGPPPPNPGIGGGGGGGGGGGMMPDDIEESRSVASQNRKALVCVL